MVASRYVRASILVTLFDHWSARLVVSGGRAREYSGPLVAVVTVGSRRGEEGRGEERRGEEMERGDGEKG